MTICINWEFFIGTLNRKKHNKNSFKLFLKRENILLVGEHIKLADFGSCKGIYSELPYTEYISTRWYRSPECLLTDGFYNSKVYYILDFNNVLQFLFI